VTSTIAQGHSDPGHLPHGQDQRSSGRYRADIDGLRAFAVLPIVFCHLGLPGFDGGYVGVDIFFVISGYLIGGIVLDQIHRGTYSAAAFYIRRFRRIVPALAAMLVVTTIAMCVFALPYPLLEYGNSLIASMLSVSNFYFWLTAGYFEAPAASKPLLHTWSLAVEEQYYLIFPFLMFMVGRRSRGTIQIVLGGLALLSFVASMLGAFGKFDQQDATFYLLPTRLWELLLGVLAVEARFSILNRRGARELAAAIGALMLLAPIFLYTPETPFPGLAALAPCLGTAMLLTTGAHGETIARKGLAFGPFVFFGLISYSLYLWHWPVIVLIKEALPIPELSVKLQLAALSASVALAWLSWRIIERPWRNPAISGRTIVAGTAISATVIVATGVALVASHGWPARYPPQVVRIAAMLHPLKATPSQKGRCFLSSEFPTSAYDSAFCLKRDPANRNILLMGDSHAAHLWFGLHNRYPRLNILQYSVSGCKPLVKQRDGAAARCTSMMGRLYRNYLAKGRIDWIILAANWAPADLSNLPITLDWLRRHNMHVVLAGPVVRYKMPLPEVLALAVNRGDMSLVEKLRNKSIALFDRQIERLARAHHAIYFSPYRTFCKTGTCAFADANGLPLEFDAAHFTASGSMLVATGFPIDQIPYPNGAQIHQGRRRSAP
jgi:peptidoglycan/LPS O-acetylase OafA/YrhL